MKATIRDEAISAPQKLSPEDAEFDAYLEGFKKRVYDAFCDNINTPGIVIEVDEAIKKTNIYL